ncbi:MAG: hypothetical protein ACYTG6_04985 [Planctomycetota bacterium]
MKVQRCLSCGARYDVEQLDLGAVFECRRCGKPVTVGEGDEKGPPPGVSWGLFVAGLVMVGSAFLLANPSFGVNAQAWPWELFRTSESLLLKCTFVLWTALGIWAVITSLLPGARGRSVVIVAIGAFLLMLCSASTEAGFTITDEQPLPWMMGIIALAAGLELVRRGRSGVAARSLAFIGGLAILWFHARGFQPYAGSNTDICQLEILSRDLISLVGGELLDVRPEYKWEILAKYWAIVAACLVGWVMALGWKNRLFALIGLLLLYVGLLLPGFVSGGRAMSDAFSWRLLADTVTAQGAAVLVTHGLALWLLGMFAVADLVGPREETA